MKALKRLCAIVLAVIIGVGFVPMMPGVNGVANATDAEFYAVLNTAAEGTEGQAGYKPAYTLSFYYDGNKSTHTESTKTVYADLPKEASLSTGWGYESVCQSIKNVVIDASVANYSGLKSTYCMFFDMKNADNISGCEYLNVGNVTNMASMFELFAWNSTSITAVPDVSDWDTSKVTSMGKMFVGYAKNSQKKLNPLDLSCWDISMLEYTNEMFAEYNHSCSSGNPIVYARDWSTINASVESIDMFAGSKLKNAPISGSGNFEWDKANTSNTGCFTKPIASITTQSGTTKYASVQEAINAAKSGQTVKMIADSKEDVTVASDDNLTIDLNGKTLKGLGTDSSPVIINKGKLTIMDSDNSGKITGAHRDSCAGGGVINEGTFNMTGGSITGNYAQDVGGVFNFGTFNMSGGSISGNSDGNSAGGVFNLGTFNMSGGSISGNTTWGYGGVYNFGNMNVSGKSVITGNKIGEGGTATDSNVYLPSGKTITVGTGSNPVKYLESGAYIGVTTKDTPSKGNPLAITGNNSADYSSYFHSDNGSYKIYNTKSGEVQIVKSSVHEHVWTYSATGDTLKAWCAEEFGNSNCDYYGESKADSVKIVAPERTAYGDTTKSNEASLIGSTLGDLTITASDIKYYKKGETTALASAPTDAGTYQASITVDTDKTAFVEYTIAKKQLSISTETGKTTTVADKTYDGTTAATATIGTVEGVVGNDKVTIEVDSAAFGNKNVEENKTVTVAYKMSGDDSANYIKPENGSTKAEITAKAVNVVAESKSSYVGSAIAELTYTNDALCTGDSFTGALATAADKNKVGKYDIVQNTLNVKDGNDGKNYEILYTKGTYEVTAKELQALSFSGVSAGNVSKTYGDAKFTQSVSGAQTSVKYSSSDEKVASVDSKTGEVTIHKAGIAVIKATAEETTKYAEASAQYILTVNRKQIAISADNKTTYLYEELESLTYTAEALLDSDKLNGEPATDADKNVAGAYKISKGTLDAGANYEIIFTEGTYIIEDPVVEETKSVAEAKVKNTTASYSWMKVTGATKYKVYFAKCGAKKYKCVKTTKLTSFTKKNLERKTSYKIYVKAYDADGNLLVKTPIAHILTRGGAYSNATAVTADEELSVTQGETTRVIARITAKDGKKPLFWKHHVKAKIRYYSSDKSVATVDGKGNVSAVGRGVAYIYSLAPSGVSATTKVRVLK